MPVFPQTLLYRPTLTRLIISITLLCASIAWGGWVFLHSIGDPHRAERIAREILKSPDARDEIAAPFTDQLVNYAPLDAQSQAKLRSVVSDVLADSRIVDNFVAAFGSAQANALGIEDERPTSIDVGQMVEVVREHVAVEFPELAAQIPASTEKIEIPEVKTTAIGDIRDLANTWTIWLALLSFGSLVALTIFGDRRVVLRSFGFWAIFTGAFWAIGPRLVPMLASSYAPQADAIIKAMVNAVAGQITTTATILVVCGILAFVARAVFFGRDYVQQTSAAGAAPAGQYPPGYSGGPYQAAPMPQPLAPVYGQSAPAYHQPYTQPYTQPGYATTVQPVTGGYAPQPPAQTPAQTPVEWLPEPTGQVPWSTVGPDTAQPGYVQQPWPSNIPEPAPILLRPLDLPSSSDSLYPLTNPDSPPDGRY
jgi:hypothetical protein